MQISKTVQECWIEIKIDQEQIVGLKLPIRFVYFDTNLEDHHHFFCMKSSRLIDVETDEVKISKLPKLPKGKKFKSVEVIINITD